MLLYLDRELDRVQDGDLRQVLDTPRVGDRMGPEQQAEGEDDVYYAADRWLSTLAAFEERAGDVIDQLERMINR